MATSLEEALKKAFADKGQELPSASQKKSQGQDGKRGVVHVSYGESHGRRHVEGGRNRPPHSANQARKHHSSPAAPVNSGHPGRKPGNKVAPATASNPGTGHARPPTKAVQPQLIKKPPLPDYTIRIGDNPTCLINAGQDDYVYSAPAISGREIQAHGGRWDDEREVAIGLDFGTSSVKVIVGDAVLEKAFAVPFSEEVDIRRYLLPSRLYETAEGFSLNGVGGNAYRDLKLALLADPNDGEAQVRVAAFLALVIRHARGWLLSEQREVYAQTNILWKLAVGLPAAHHLQDKRQGLFKRVALAGWLAASSGKQALDRDAISAALTRATQLSSGTAPAQLSEDVEVSVVPEIAAQIYGYVASNRFDGQARNLFLMVDVGAGTVDSSLFQVKAGRGGKFGFTFYTTEVQPNGVMNLHRHRMQWWEGALGKAGGQFKPDPAQFHLSKFSTDRMTSIPEAYIGYFSNTSVEFRCGVEDPDQNFFMKRVVAQVRGKTLYRTWKDKFLSQNDLSGVPMFLCGGGTRMKFYRNLEQEIQHMPGCTWLKAVPRQIEMPKRLIAPGLSPQEYDRLSVAFGLSFLDVSEVIKAVPQSTIAPDRVISWRDNYIDKDQC